MFAWTTGAQFVAVPEAFCRSFDWTPIHHMTSLTGVSLAAIGLDGAALKPAEVDLCRATDLDVPSITVDCDLCVKC
jgi:hypothetical protein